ncbi:Protein of unknown function [Lactobacillus helveticus CIRM-BIA 951]|uniref:Uncharacterized protein n=1 Tax=Lactobacillus helveticus CIRM-BIA 951 TaxID=1226334 RepID=U6F3J2_LACHE|nr:Protein of unknown function [Lactobacillus helveticus CIRM-BIA 951]
MSYFDSRVVECPVWY